MEVQMCEEVRCYVKGLSQPPALTLTDRNPLAVEIFKKRLRNPPGCVKVVAELRQCY